MFSRLKIASAKVKKFADAEYQELKGVGAFQRELQSFLEYRYPGKSVSQVMDHDDVAFHRYLEHLIDTYGSIWEQKGNYKIVKRLGSGAFLVEPL